MNDTSDSDNSTVFERWLRDTKIGRSWERRRHDARWIRDSSFFRERDPEENERSKPPADESCQLAAVWLSEVFAPSTIDGLIEGLRKSGWDHRRGGSTNLIEWLEGARSGPGSAWASVGFVQRPGEGVGVLRDDLPPGIRAVELGLTSVTPSLTVLTGCFILDVDAAKAYHEVLSRDYVTTQLPLDVDAGRPFAHLWWRIRYGPGWLMTRGHRIHGPDFARRDAAREYSASFHQSCALWLSTRFPGSFARSQAESLPGAAFFITEQAEPNSDGTPPWMDTAGIGQSWDAWKSTDLQGLSLVIPRAEDVPNSLRLAARRTDAATWGEDDDSNWVITQRLIHYVRGLLPKWACLVLLNQQRDALASLRDLTPAQKEFRVIRDLRNLRSTILGAAMDIELLARELGALGKDDRRMRFGTGEFFRTNGQEDQLLDVIASTLQERASDLAESNRLLTDTTMSISTLTSAISNIRLQRLIIGITALSVLTALLALVVATGNN